MNGPVDFFISYTRTDQAWAEWIAWTLSTAGYSLRIQAWDFKVGTVFPGEMQDAEKDSARTIAVISPEYFKSDPCRLEWAAALANDSSGKHGKLIPIRVADFRPDGQFAALVYLDLVKLAEPQAKDTLLKHIASVVKNAPLKPTTPPAFPSAASPAAAAKPPPFPGTPVSGQQFLHNLPFAPNPFFTDGLKLLPQLRSALQRQSAAAITQPQAVHGLGGVGKTQLAIEYAWRHQADYDAVLWVGAASKTELQANIAALARLLALPEAEATQQEPQVQAVLGWLRAHERWLLILDNADTAEAAAAVPQLLPPGLRGHVIVTSRRADWPVNFADLEVRVLPELVAAAFLRARAGKGGFDPGPEADARAAARELGGLPLALEQAGAYLARYHINFAGYLELLKTSRAKLLAYPALGGTRHLGTVATTWLVNEPHLSATARAVLQIAAFLAPDDIPRALFEQGKEILAGVAGVIAAAPCRSRRKEAGTAQMDDNRSLLTSAPTAEDSGDIGDALAELADLSLVELEPGGFGCHRLLQAVLLDRLAPADRKFWGQIAVGLVNDYAPADPDDVRTWLAWDPLRPHASALLQALGEDADAKAATLANQLALLFAAKALYAEAELLYLRAVAIYERTLGGDHSHFASALGNLARLLKDTNRLAEAEPLMRRALAIMECNFGPEHPKVATDLNNLALLLQDTGRLTEAEPLMRRALAIDERSFGPEHPEVATDLNNLAGLLRATNRLAEAEPLMCRVVAIFEKSLGENHPNVATAINNLARLLQDTDRLAESEPLMRRALAIDERSFGPEHPAVAIGLNNLAQLLKATDRLAEAEPLQRRAAGIFLHSLGPEHPKTKTVLGNYQSLLTALKLPAAEMAARLRRLTAP